MFVVVIIVIIWRQEHNSSSSQQHQTFNNNRSKVTCHFTRCRRFLGYRISSFHAQHQKTKSSVDAFIGRYENYIVMDESGQYLQLSNALTLVNSSLSQKLNLGPFNSTHTLQFQYSSSDRIKPVNLQYAVNVHIKLPLFQKRMKTHLGVDAFVIPSYDTPSFFPVAGEFYGLSTGNQSDNILYVNPYFNAQVDRLFFFIKGVNSARNAYPLNAGLVSGFNLPNYNIRFGIRWTLLD